MKRPLLVLVLCLLFLNNSGYAAPTGINILSEKYHVEGSDGFTSFNYTANDRVSGDLSRYFVYDGQNEDDWGVGVTARPSSPSSHYLGHVSIGGPILSNDSDSILAATAEMTFMFQTEFNTLSFLINKANAPHPSFGNNILSLYDTTDGIQLYDDSPIVLAGEGEVNEPFEFYVTPDHTYSLTMTISLPGEDRTGVRLNHSTHYSIDSLQSYASPIPSPSAFMLGSIGVGCVSWLRRRRTL